MRAAWRRRPVIPPPSARGWPDQHVSFDIPHPSRQDFQAPDSCNYRELAEFTYVVVAEVFMRITGPGRVSGPPDRAITLSQTGERLDACLEDARGALSGHTVRALRADLDAFASWCAERDLSPLPARRGDGCGVRRCDGRAPGPRPPCAVTSSASPWRTGRPGSKARSSTPPCSGRSSACAAGMGLGRGRCRG